MSLASNFFDSLRYAKELKAADVPPKQAEAQAEALSHAFSQQNQALEDRLEHQRQTLETGFKHEISEAETRTDSALVRLESKMDSGFSRVDNEFQLVRKDIQLVDQRSESRFKLLYWMLGVLIATMAPIAFKAYFGGA